MVGLCANACAADTSPIQVEGDGNNGVVKAEKSRFAINYWSLMQKIWVMAFCEFAVFTVTFA